MSILKSRITNLHGTEYEWSQLDKATGGFIPFNGEYIIFDSEILLDGSTATLPEGRLIPYTHTRIKIGDGKTSVVNLPFLINNVFEEIATSQEGDTFFIDSGNITKKTI